MISRLRFSIEIKADQATIWNALWSERNYRDWASVFAEGSYAISKNWEEGSKVHFLSPDQSGIYSIIETHIPAKIMAFKHIGTLAEGKEQPIDDESKKWSGATECYTVSESADSNTLTIDIDVRDEHLEFMSERLPKALEKIRGKCNESDV